jgi:hypothetical protein
MKRSFRSPFWPLLVVANEIHKRVSRAAPPAHRLRITPFLVPALIALALFPFFRSRTRDLPALADALARKHTLNICQVYAFGYQQRHSDFFGLHVDRVSAAHVADLQWAGPL